jgi:hypothetical protein
LIVGPFFPQSLIVLLPHNSETQRSYVKLAYVRDIFNGLIQRFDVFAIKLAEDSSVIACKDFEKAIVKLQNNMESTLQLKHKLFSIFGK